MYVTTEPTRAEPAPGRDTLVLDRRSWAHLAVNDEFPNVRVRIDGRTLRGVLGPAVDHPAATGRGPTLDWLDIRAHDIAQLIPELPWAASCWKASLSLRPPPPTPRSTSAAGNTIPITGVDPTASSIVNACTGSGWSSSAPPPLPGSTVSEVSTWLRGHCAGSANHARMRIFTLWALRSAALRPQRARAQIYGLTKILTGTRNRLREAVIQSTVTLQLRQRARRSRKHCDPPGRAATGCPKLTRGPDTCRSIVARRSPAGLTPA